MVDPYRRGRMKRVTLGSAFTIAGVLSAGAAAALVNTRVLETAGGDATGTNQVALEEARDTPRAWSRPRGVPTPAAPAPQATALGGESGVFTEDASGAGPPTSAVGALDDVATRQRTAPTTGARSRATSRTAPQATTTTSVPPASTVPTTTGVPAPATTSSSSPPSPSTTTTTSHDDDGRNEHLDWSHWFPGPSTTTTAPPEPEPPPPEPTTTAPGASGPTTEPPPTSDPDPEDPPTTTSTTFPPDD